MINTRQELHNEIDMLNGNINRMCVCKSYKELNCSFLYAKKRLEEICKYNIDRLDDDKERDSNGN